jgi:hypothetical protein
MSIKIRFVPKDKTVFRNAEDIQPIAKTIADEITQRKLYTEYSPKYNLTISENSFEIEFLTMCAKGSEDVNFIAREFSSFLYEIGYSELIYIAGVKDKPEPGNLQFESKHKLPLTTKNHKLAQAYVFFDKEIPERFLCKLTQQFMDKPVYLKQNPDIKYEEIHLKHWLFTHDEPHDPFTRKIIDISDIVVDQKLYIEINAILPTLIVNSLKNKHEEVEKIKREQEKAANEEKIKLNQIVVRCKLDDASPKSLRKGARYAAAKNYVDDLAYLIKKVPNAINEQDDNEQNKKTPLHWAAKNGSHECIKLLRDHKAKSDIPDFFNKTALDYAKEYAITHNDQKILDLFEIKDVQLQQIQTPEFKN